MEPPAQNCRFHRKRTDTIDYIQCEICFVWFALCCAGVEEAPERWACTTRLQEMIQFVPHDSQDTSLRDCWQLLMHFSRSSRGDELAHYMKRKPLN